MSTNTNEQRFTARLVEDQGRDLLRLEYKAGALRYVCNSHLLTSTALRFDEAMALLSPADCAYTLVFTRGKGEDAEVACLDVSPNDVVKNPHMLSMSKDHALGYFAHYDTVEITGLRAVVPEPQGPHCRMHGSYLYLHTGLTKQAWAKCTRNYLGDLSTTDLAAICNPHKCDVRIKAVGPNEHKVTYFTAGKAMEPGDLLEYEYLKLISAEPSEEN